MASVSHILDTSALLAHYFDEAGADLVGRLWKGRSARPGICAVTVTELRTRLAEEIADDAEATAALEAYLDELTVCLPIDRAVAEIAWQIRQSTPGRIPLVDALIAATARAADAVLVHRDPHMARIPKGVVRQIVLPDK